ncbi:MAG: hypothetical protein QOJ29_4675 [Thermoleophilaceae bacterium]|jgi:S-DNA-T family DNA segregation ATPase FtsK/SpoIIIE|nr:hypothetical protein [Thermoleophilaceae bacterium]
MELFVVEGPDAGRSFSLAAESVIGRDPTAAVHLTDEEVSRRHAIISLGEGLATVEDLGSVNGTHTDAGQVVGEAAVRAGDRIRVGQTVMELRELGGPEDPENLKPTKTSMERPT